MTAASYLRFLLCLAGIGVHAFEMKTTFCNRFLAHGISYPDYYSKDHSIPLVLIYSTGGGNLNFSAVMAPWMKRENYRHIIDAMIRNGDPVLDCALRNISCERINSARLQDFHHLTDHVVIDHSLRRDIYMYLFYNKRYCPYCACYIICVELMSALYPKSAFNTYCPNPCRRNPCLGKAHVVHGSCRVTGLLTTDYECECESGFSWDKRLQKCKSRDPCLDKDSPLYPCDPEGTSSCLFSYIPPKVFCYCKLGYAGPTCNQTFDACKMKSTDSQLLKVVEKGDIMCNVNQDNTCQYVPTSGSYRCTCNEMWQIDPTIAYDNCLLKKTECENLICLSGTCSSNFYGNKAVCKCDPGYGGRGCSKWTGEWSSWSLWDRCRPACGKYRYSSRWRECLSAKTKNSSHRSDCTGQSVDYHQCKVHECAPKKQDLVGQAYQVRYLALYFAILANIVLASVLVVGWRWLLNGLLKRNFISLIRRKKE